MKHTIQLSNNYLVMHSIYEGEFNYSAFENAFHERITHPMFNQIKILVIDYSLAEIGDYTTEEVKQGADLAATAVKLNPDLTVIGLLPSIEFYGLSRMWQAYSDKFSWDTHMVRTRGECEGIINKVLSKSS